MTAQRVQLSRRKGFRLPADTVVVARPSRWGNPFNVGQWGVVLPANLKNDGLPLIPLRGPDTLQRALDLYVAWLFARCAQDPLFLKPLWGKNLACWCACDQPCHADILLRAASSARGVYPNTVST